MNNHRLLTGVLAAVLLSGGACAVGQTRRVLTLEQLFEIAEANSAQLRPSFSAQEEARRQVGVARAGRLPEVEGSLSLSYLGTGFTTDRHFADYQKAPLPHLGNGLGLSVEQPVYAGGAITAGIEMAELRAGAARYATEQSRGNVRFRLTELYLEIYKRSNLRAVLESNLAQAREVLAQMRARYDQGVALQNDITRYELLVSNLELSLTRTDNTLSILGSSLCTTAGLPEGTEVVPDSAILARALPVDGEDWWQQGAQASAPSLKLGRAAVELGRTGEKLARSEMLPRIGIRAGWSLDGPILTEVPPINRNLSYWYAGVGVSYSLSSLYKGRRELAQSRAATQTALDRLEAQRQNVGLEVNAAYVRYLEAYEELRTRQKSVELAERNYAVTSTRYSEGMALITDMLDAANSKLDAEQMLVNARIDIIYYYYKLLFTSGKI